MTILLLGSGGREHAFAWKMLQSDKCTKLFVAPGNAGTGSIATNVNLKITDFEAIKSFALSENVEMVVVGPEDPLVKGIFDFFQNDSDLKHIPVIGPSKKGAQLEGSKEFAKEFLVKHNTTELVYAGASLPGCILDRPLGIKSMQQHFNCSVLIDCAINLTSTGYNEQEIIHDAYRFALNNNYNLYTSNNI